MQFTDSLDRPVRDGSIECFDEVGEIIAIYPLTEIGTLVPGFLDGEHYFPSDVRKTILRDRDDRVVWTQSQVGEGPMPIRFASGQHVSAKVSKIERRLLAVSDEAALAGFKFASLGTYEGDGTILHVTVIADMESAHRYADMEFRWMYLDPLIPDEVQAYLRARNRWVDG